MAHNEDGYYYTHSGGKHKHKTVIQSFDTIIDMYLVSSIDDKLEFIACLDNYEFELFIDYLNENYPDEFEKIP